MKHLVLTDKEVELLQLALKVFLKTTEGKNISATLTEGLTKRLQDYNDELFASVHSQGG